MPRQVQAFSWPSACWPTQHLRTAEQPPSGPSGPPQILKVAFSLQVCVGAVQRALVAHVQSGHPGPYLLPPCPLCGAHPVVQCHHEYTLIGKHLSSLAQFLIPAASVQGTACDTANAHLLLLLLVRLRSTFCTESFSGGSNISAVLVPRVTH